MKAQIHLIRAQRGSLAAVDLLLQQEDINIDAQNRLELETPLHMAVKYTDDPSNKNKQRPIQLVDSNNQELRNLLQKATLALQMDTSDIAQDDSNEDDDPPSDDLSDDGDD
ncbi:7223_t:CDS:2 [Racocetra fulgida]|uniref:7223_t:CDS:1 n=1 Tax=Racocetra fulgida TaxID=60492 RepID=A0A9N9FTP8_9GLOM|nr:7223_t:CDS:2 [Racocetra fulgida]